jgi:L-asparaginase/Glu-tRNA(Gln) amidotransferase subunit D
MAPIKHTEHYYETTKELIDMGVHFLFDISIEHALVKLMLAHKNFSTQENILTYIL